MRVGAMTTVYGAVKEFKTTEAEKDLCVVRAEYEGFRPVRGARAPRRNGGTSERVG